MTLILSNNLLEIEWKEGEKIEGALCFNKPWPGMARTIYGNHDRFLDTYYNPYEGCYFSGDGAMKDENGYITVTGRMDDVINISGHRLGTAEIEDVMVSILIPYHLYNPFSRILMNRFPRQL